MKLAVLFLMFLFFGVGAFAIARLMNDDSKKILLFYRGKVSGKHLKNAEWVELVVDTTKQYACKFGVLEYSRIILANDIVESNLNPRARNKKEGSYGLTQISAKALPFLYSELKKSERNLPPMNRILRYPDYQIALGVLAFKFKLRDAKGDPWEAVRRYNGRGPAAYRHQAKVRSVYNGVFLEIGHVVHSVARPTLVRKGEKMFKRLLLVLALLPGMNMKAAEVPEAQSVVVADKASVPGAEILRDFDFKQYPCYGCPGDKSMIDGIPGKVKAQMAVYTAARDAYKNSWAESDVKKASDYAIRSDAAAWPWVNLANHIWEINGNPDDADKALDKAEALISGHKYQDVKKMIDSNRHGIAELRKALALAKEESED